ncbi:MAG TPA: hypothetical protein VHO70_16200 [Chitinispirillaceae bacterium]|nr:hypothetical protein [Chitinispirillaceae bacterium]
MVKILHLVLLLSFSTYSLATSTNEYLISGTVTKKGGGPLEKVTVLLKSKNVSVVTAADGKFKLASTVAVRMNTAQIQTLSLTLRGNAVAFSQGTGKLSGNVMILSGNGKCIASTDFSCLNPATDKITLPQLASGINIVRVTANNTVYTCQVIQLGNILHLLNNHTRSLSDGEFTLDKSATASAAVDTLIATKNGFKNAATPITSYTLNNISIEMDSSTGSDEIAWGKVENPTSQYTIETLPEYSALTANSKLPDPFKKLDGTRIKDMSEWAFRREEIRQQLFKYITGEKPVPAKGSVSGTVTTTKISVKVSEGGKSCSFDVTVDMNGATQPAPAIISYGAGASAPSGVAKITFSAIEGGSGDKKGPFYTFYGSNHPAGYLIAQAWQISRIIDLLEQNPTIIDPYRIALTGCSRNGKGAFWGGVFDNRVALTIPCESGMGGTVGLRLKKQLDPGDNNKAEWPYHAISYVRWLSDVALGKFTSGNDASHDNTDRLPVDIHSAMALIAPRAIYIVDNPGITNLDPKSAYVTGMAGKAIFEAFGIGDNFTYEGASGSHCQWRTQYTASLNAMVDKYLKGNTSVSTGKVNTDLGNKPNPEQYCDWDATKLAGEPW